MALIAISIINYRTQDMTIAAVESVLKDLGERDDARVVIVDNKSEDGSSEAIQGWIAEQDDARLLFVQSETNSGFSGGHNQGMAAVPGAAFYLILNSDALLQPGFFENLLKTPKQNEKVGLFAPQLEWEDGRPQISCFRFASPLSELIRGAATGPITRIFQFSDIALPLPPPLSIEWASFACILLDGDMVRELGPMDEGYFLYFEDSEYALRANRAGWKVRYNPAARAIHFRGGSGPVKTLQKAKKRLPDYYWRARTRFFRQAHGPLGPLLGNLCWILGRMIAQARRLTGRGVPPAHEAEWRDIWLGFFNPLKPDPRSQR